MTGLLAVQNTITRSSAESMQHSTAVMFVRDLVSRIRQNPGQVEQYAGSGYGDSSRVPALPAADCSLVECTPREVVEHDLWQWQDMIRGMRGADEGGHSGGLDRPWACVEQDARLVTISIYWRGAGPAAFTGAEAVCGPPDDRRYDDPTHAPGNNRWRRGLSVSFLVGSTS
jgi:hypothetical protein